MNLNTPWAIRSVHDRKEKRNVIRFGAVSTEVALVSDATAPVSGAVVPAYGA